MSAIAALYNTPVTPEQWAEWSFAHAAHHQDINRVIYEQLAISLPMFILDPFDPENPEVWLQNHQVMHQNMGEVLGIGGFDLAEVSFKNPEQTAGWIFLNSTEHKKAADILGIG